jgi:hypothetical protein
VLRAFNAVTLATSVQSQNKRVRVEGEVLAAWRLRDATAKLDRRRHDRCRRFDDGSVCLRH